MICIDGDKVYCFGDLLEAWEYGETDEGHVFPFCYEPFVSWARPYSFYEHATDDADREARGQYQEEYKEKWVPVVEYYCNMLPDNLTYDSDREELTISSDDDTKPGQVLWALHDIRKFSEWPGIALFIMNLMDQGLSVKEALCCSYGVYVPNTYDMDQMLAHPALLNHRAVTHLAELRFNPAHYRKLHANRITTKHDMEWPSHLSTDESTASTLGRFLCREHVREIDNDALRNKAVVGSVIVESYQKLTDIIKEKSCLDW